MDELIVVYDYSYLSFIQTILIAFSVIQISLLLAIFIVAIFVYYPYKNILQKQLEDPSFDGSFFIHKYEDKYDFSNINKIECVSVDELNMNSYVFENTPLGTVIMRFNKDLECFEYWSNKHILYKYLQTVARKYACMMNCIDVYKVVSSDKLVDSNILNSDGLEDDGLDYDSQEDKEDKEDSNVFATYKKYNKNKHSSLLHGCNKEIEEENNIYKHAGKISDFKFIKKDDYEIKKEKNITFDEFKQMIQSIINIDSSIKNSE